MEPSIAEKAIPKVFVPSLVNGYAMVGICLIRLRDLRPKGFPRYLGFGSENAAHRFAVKWKSKGVWQQGVYIPRRDTSRMLNVFLGGRLFPGVHHKSSFFVNENHNQYSVGFDSQDGTSMKVACHLCEKLPASSVFKSIEESSNFFKLGNVGYSPSLNRKSLQGLELVTDQWSVQPLEVSDVDSSYFSNHQVFPKGSLHFDHALLMKDIAHSWRSKESMVLYDQ